MCPSLATQAVVYPFHLDDGTFSRTQLLGPFHDRNVMAMAAPRLALLALLLLAITAVLSDSSTSERPDLALKLDPSQPVTVTLADGSERELSVAEFEELARQRAAEHAQLQPDGKAPAPEVRHHQEDLDDVRKQDPQFALHIELARRAFAELQRHGYARGFTLTGFSEQDTSPLTAFDGEPAADYRVELVLRAQADANSGVEASTGTGTKLRTSLSYEVHLLVDAVADRRQKRAVRLSIQPTAAMLEREAKREHQKLGGRPAIAKWLLVGGVTLIAAGVLVMYTSRDPTPAPRPRRRSSEIWELVDDDDKPVKAKATKPSQSEDKKTQ
ncbi:hypothetical protein BBJ28_00019516 [Nothophytophthora sp. Chile5]|nr:hypothetical protein BBJ28_00019516 [Nothophytophthora sp. Chile5]